MRKWA